MEFEAPLNSSFELVFDPVLFPMLNCLSEEEIALIVASTNPNDRLVGIGVDKERILGLTGTGKFLLLWPKTKLKSENISLTPDGTELCVRHSKSIMKEDVKRYIDGAEVLPLVVSFPSKLFSF